MIFISIAIELVAVRHVASPQKSSRDKFGLILGTFSNASDCSSIVTARGDVIKYALVIAVVTTLATPALAEEVGVGVGVGPAGAGVTVGQSRDYDRDRERERTTVSVSQPIEPLLSRRITVTEREAKPSSKNAIKGKGPG